MQLKLQQLAEKYTKHSRGRRVWHGFVRVMACFVVFCTTYALILPAITMEQDVFCSLEEHTHTEECYIRPDRPTKLICSPDQYDVHEHTSECYNASGYPVCGQADYIAHIHNGDCYDVAGEQVCTFGQKAKHDHNSNCYTEVEADADGHTHSGDCYKKEKGELTCTTEESEGHAHGEGCYDAEGNLTCTAEESEGHGHGDDCYAWTETLACDKEETPAPEPVLTCTIPIAQEHVHGDGCFATSEDQPLTCGLDEGQEVAVEGEEPEVHTHTFLCYGTWELICPAEEHEHELACFSDTEADLETEEVWKKTLPKLTGVYVDDLLAMAESQLDYTESEKNYIVLEDGETMNGYTRYGAWYGDPYGEWDGMFVSFILNYAGADKLEALKDFPLEADAAEWAEELEEAELFLKAEDGVPEPGDLIFFDNDEDEENIPDHVGIVIEIFEDELDGITKIRVYEGDVENQVQKNKYELPIFEDEEELEESPIVGYGLLPEVPDYDPAQYETETPAETDETDETIETEAVTYNYYNDQIYVEVRLPETTTVPVDAELVVTPIESDEEKKEQAKNLVDGEVANVLLYDISFLYNGEHWDVDDTAQVSIAFKEDPRVDTNSKIQVVHFDNDEIEPPKLIENVILEPKEIQIPADVMQAETTVEQELQDKGNAVFQGSGLQMTQIVEYNTVPKLNAAPVDVNTDAAQADVGTDETQADVGTDETQADVNADTAPADTDADAAQADSDADTALVDADADAVQAETFMEYRTVIEFTTNGFSTFAVVEVKTEQYSEPVVTYSNVTNVLDHIQIDNQGSLDGMTFVISTYYAADVKQYALTSNEAADGTDHLAAVPVTRDDNDTVTADGGPTNEMLWKFVARQGGGYSIQSVATEDYLIFDSNGNDNVTLDDQEPDNAIYVVTGGQYNNNPASELKSPMISLTTKGANDMTGRELSLRYDEDDTDRYFTAYNNNQFNALVLSVPTLATKVLGGDGVSYNVAGDDYPLDGRVIAISRSDAANDNVHRALTAVDAGTVAPTGLKAFDVTMNGDTVYASANTLWLFTKVAGEQNTYYIQAYDPVTKTAGNYLQINGGNNIATIENGIGVDTCKIQVVRGETGDTISLLGVNQNRYLSIVFESNGQEYVQEYRFTGYGKRAGENNHPRGDLILSEYPVQTTPAQTFVTNLDGQKLAIVSVRETAQNNPVHAVTSTSTGVNESQRLGVAVTWTDNNKNYVDIPDEYVASSYWTFEAVDAAMGEYNIKSSDGKYLNIGETSATLADAPQSITVTSKVVNNMEVVFLNATGTNYYLNRYGGSNNTGYRGYATDTNDAGCRFVLTREIGYKATVLSRYELKEAALLEDSKLVIFVRQKEGDVYHYYAVDGNGNAQEIYLEGDDLDDGSIVYTTSKEDLLLWDGTRSYEGGGSWNSNNNPAADIDLQIFNVSTGKYLVPHRTGNVDYITRPAKGTTGDDLRQHDLWKNNDMNYIGVTADSAEANDVKVDIANMLITELNKNYNLDGDDTNGNEFVLDDTTRRLAYDPATGTFITDDISNFNANAKDTDAKQQNVIYFAIIAPEPKEEVKAHETLVGQILTREEYQNAAKEYGADYPFIIFAQDANGKFFALDADGKARSVNVMYEDTLDAGERIVFDPDDISDDYNSNLILWDATATADDQFAENQPNVNGWVDLTLVNVGTGEYLGPHYNGEAAYYVTTDRPVEGDHSPGFFRISDDDNFAASNAFANYLGVRKGNYTGPVNGAPTYKDERFYKLMLDSANGEFDIIKGWYENNNDQSANFTGFNGTTEYVFYVAMVVDRGVTIDENNDVDEYDVVDGVTDNVKMYLFNYGAGIDYYGAVQNGTTYTDNLNPDIPDYPEHDNLVYRFFHRPEFRGQAIDGTNETNTYIEHARGDPYYDWPDIEYATTLSPAGYPEVVIPDSNGDGKKDFTITGGEYYDLEYLFKPETFVATPGNTGEANDSSLTIKQTMNGNVLIPADNGTAISTGTDGRTLAAAQGDSTVQNPNYAKRTYSVGDGSVTGLFQKDPKGNYYYNSAQNAAYFNGKSFELYDYALLPSANQNTAGGNFLPFNQAHSTGRLIDTDPGWQNNQRVDYPINDRTYRLNGVYQNDDVTMGRNAVTDLWFGMSIEIEFAMTPNGLLELTDANGSTYYEPLEFEFAGDDDVLVYIDDVLCLDIGRVHGIAKASIDFSTGVCESDAPSTATANTNLYDLFSAAGKAGVATAADDENTTVEFVETEAGNMIFKDNSVHTLKFFYMERGGNISNCYIRYNLQPIKPGGLSVEKVVNGLNEDGTYPGIDGTPTEYEGEYSFRLVDINQNSTPIQPALTEFAYELYDNGIPVPVEEGSDVTIRHLKVNRGEKIPGSDKYYYYTDEFTLKHGQKIHFTNIITGTSLYVQETSFKNAQPVDSNYWWRITGDDGVINSADGPDSSTGTGGSGDDVDPGIGVANNRSAMFVIEEETSIEVVCSNTLESVSLGVKKIMKSFGKEEPSEDTTTRFEISYTITPPDNYGENDNPADITGKVFLRNGVWYDKDGNVVSKAEDAEPNRNASNDGPDTSEYNWLSLTVPFGSVVRITEVKADGYAVYWDFEGWTNKTEGTTTTYSQIATDSGDGTTTDSLYMVAEDNFVTITNVTGPELPKTGGTGTYLYTAGGALLILAAFALLLYYHTKRGKEDYASS